MLHIKLSFSPLILNFREVVSDPVIWFALLFSLHLLSDKSISYLSQVSQRDLIPNHVVNNFLYEFSVKPLFSRMCALWRNALAEGGGACLSLAIV